MYRGLNLNYQTTLDIASEGNFNTRSPDEARRLIEIVTSGKGLKKMEVERGDTVESVVENQLAKVKATLESVQALLLGQNHSKSDNGDEDVLPDQGKSVESIGITGFKDHRLGFNSGSFTNNYDATTKLSHAIGEWPSISMER